MIKRDQINQKSFFNQYRRLTIFVFAQMSNIQVFINKPHKPQSVFNGWQAGYTDSCLA